MNAKETILLSCIKETEPWPHIQWKIGKYLVHWIINICIFNSATFTLQYNLLNLRLSVANHRLSVAFYISDEYQLFSIVSVCNVNWTVIIWDDLEASLNICPYETNLIRFMLLVMYWSPVTCCPNRRWPLFIMLPITGYLLHRELISGYLFLRRLPATDSPACYRNNQI